MNRDAILVYLKNILDLEFAKMRIDEICNSEMDKTVEKIHSIENKYNNNYAALQQKIEQLLTTHYQSQPEKPEPNDGGCLLILGIVLCLLSGLLISMYFIVGNGIEDFDGLCFFFIIAFLLGLISVLISFLCQHESMKQYNEQIKKIKAHNNLEKQQYEQNRSYIQQIRQCWKEIQKKYQAVIQEQKCLKKKYKFFYIHETEKVEQILTEAYSINLIPLPFHNFDGIAYIYNYMSTSQETLQDAFNHAHFENGILRIEEALQQIYWQKEESLFLQRCALARMDDMSNDIHNIGSNVERIQTNTQLMQDRSLEILHSCQQTASNSADAAKYAHMVANYSEANAYFSAARYFKT